MLERTKIKFSCFALLCFLLGGSGAITYCNKPFSDDDFLSVPMLLLQANFPAISSVYPGNGLTDIKVNESPLIVFNQEMKTATLTIQLTAGACSGTVQLSSDDFKTCVAGSITNTGDKKTFRVTATGRMQDNTTYKLKVTTGAKTSFGGAMESEWAHSTGFTTFNPLSLTGAVLWLRADSPTAVLNATGQPASSGEDIANWNDESGTSNHSQQGTMTRRPILQAGVLDGKPALRFDGIDDFLQIANITLIHGSPESTLFIVVRAIGTGLNGFDTLFGNVRFNVGFGGGSGRGQFIVNVLTQGYLTVNTNTPRNGSSASFLLMSRAASSTGTVPGVVIGDNGTLGTPLTPNWGGNTITTPAFMNIGALNSAGTPTTHFPGNIAEIMLFNRALTNTEVSTLACHFSNKYTLGYPNCP